MMTETAEPEAEGPDLGVQQEDAHQAKATADAEAAAAAEEAEVDEAVEQFRRVARRYLTGSANVFLGSTEARGDVVGGNKSVKIYPTSDLTPLVSGPVPPERLASLMQRFAKPNDHDDLVGRLRANRVLVLRGSRSTGRQTASLSALAAMHQDPRSLLALDPTTPLGRLVDQLRPKSGHLIADLATGANAPLRQHHLHAVREYLQTNDGYAIITLDPLAAVDESLSELYEWRPPASVDVLRAHLDAAGADPSDYQPVLEFEETLAYLETRPSPREVEGFSKMVILHIEGQLARHDLATYGTEAAEHLVQRLFKGTGTSLRDKAFLIALAVFERSPYATIAEAGDALYLAFEERETPEHRAGLSIFDTNRSARLDWAQAVEFDQLDINRDLAPVQAVAFRFQETWPVVLRHVWLEHPAAREPIIGWIRALGESTLWSTRVRAAIATGCLAATDLSSVMGPLLEPWAGSDLIRQRLLAAWALSAAVQQGAETEVRRVLRGWAEAGEAKRWTVVRTTAELAELLGKSAIGLISKIARRPARDPRLARELVRVVGDLLTGPVGRRMLEALEDWSQQSGHCRVLAHRAFVSAAAVDDRETQPALLAHATAEQEAWAALTALWRAVLNDATFRDDARQRLTQWVILAAQNELLESDLRRLFVDLATSPNERNRLDYLLRHLPDGAQLPALQVAERIQAQLPPL